MKVTVFNFYSIGVVAQTKPLDTDVIKVWPTEAIHVGEGRLLDVTYDKTTTVLDRHGASQNAKLEGKAYLEAKWLPYGQSNRMTSPDVVEGETVHVYRNGDTSEYFWTTLFREPELRRKEHVVFAFSNETESLKPFTEQTSYWLKVSTVDQKIHLHTAKNQGEPFEYDFILDTELGKMTFKDHVGNEFSMDSANDIFLLNSVAGAFTRWDKGDVHHVCKKYVVDCDEFTLNTPKATLNTSDLLVNGSNMAINMGQLNIAAETSIAGAAVSIAAAVMSLMGGGAGFTAAGGIMDWKGISIGDIPP